jgi:hypothetical protein
MEKIRETDILFGNIYNVGGIGRTHKGNRLFCAIIEIHQWQYCISTSRQKNETAMSILKYYQAKKRRFLQKQTGCNLWDEISTQQEAIKKIKAALNNNSVKRRKNLEEILGKAYQSKVPATVSIDIPHFLVKDVLQSRFVTDAQNGYKQIIEADKTIMEYHAMLKVPCSYNAKPMLTIVSKKRQLEREEPGGKKQRLFDDDLSMNSNSILHSMSIEINSASILQSMKSDIESALQYEEITVNDKILPLPLMLDCQTIDPYNVDVQVKELLRLMAEEDDDKEDTPTNETLLTRNELSNVIDCNIVNDDRISMSSPEMGSYLQESIGSYTMSMVRIC